MIQVWIENLVDEIAYIVTVPSALHGKDKNLIKWPFLTSSSWKMEHVDTNCLFNTKWKTHKNTATRDYYFSVLKHPKIMIIFSSLLVFQSSCNWGLHQGQMVNWHSNYKDGIIKLTLDATFMKIQPQKTANKKLCNINISPDTLIFE